MGLLDGVRVIKIHDKIRLSPELRQVLRDLEKIESLAVGTPSSILGQERLNIIRFVATQAAERLRVMFGGAS